MPDKPLDIQQFLSPAGAVAKFFPSFEKRPQQLKMALAVQNALAKTQHLVVEAGTGVGKSFAYLVPAIDLIAQHCETVLISTFTITLQEQLINKDIPFLANCIPNSFTAVLAKGRANYLCKRRLKFALKRQNTLFSRFTPQLDAVKQWASHTNDGSLSDLPFIPNPKVWDAVKSEHGNCRWRKCPHFKDCFYHRARRQLDSADLVIANHSLLFSDLVLKQQNFSLLPDYKYIIIDEAHNIEHVAENHFGIDLSNRRVKFLFDDLYNPRTHKGFLAHTNNEKTIDLVTAAAKQSAAFFKQISAWFDQTKQKTNGRCPRNFVADTISHPIETLRSHLSKMANNAEDIDEKFELLRFTNRCAEITQDLQAFLNHKKTDHVYWVEPTYSKRTALRLKSAPLNVAADVKKCLFEKYQSVVLTSATLSIDSDKDEKGFEFLTSRIGLEKFQPLKLGSPFDYSKQLTLYIESSLPNPNDKRFIDSAAQTLKKYLLKTNGRAFVLFTSYSMLRSIADLLENWLADNGFELLQHGAGIDRSILLKRFRQDNNSVLFGTDSFWQGVDVPGPALSNVIIVRLPFAVPEQPLLAGRIEQIKKQGKNPFYEYQLPSAIIKFKQGFGRLIRTKNDSGIVVVLDSRIIHKPYGQKFLNTIPKCNIYIAESE